MSLLNTSICPECGKDALLLGEGKDVKCSNCCFKGASSDIAEAYVERELQISHYETGKEGGTFPVYTCPECGYDSFVIYNGSNYCFTCGFENSNMNFCSNCGESYICSKEDLGICPNCMNYKLSKED